MSVASEITGSIAPLPTDDMSVSGVFAELTPDLYADLRRLARCFMRSERGGHTLQPTAVVNEAFLRLSRADVHLKDTLHLYRLVAQTMRRVLVDHARERSRMKRDLTRSAQAEPVTEPGPLYQSAAPLDILDIDAALDELADRTPRAAALLELRYFAGLEDMEIGELYGISRATVEREFRFAKAFLIAYGRRERLTAGASSFTSNAR